MSKEISVAVANEQLDGTIHEYSVQALWKAVKDKEVFDLDITLPIKCINNFINVFTSDDWYRVINADLSYPIIVNDIHGVLDGCHRSVKAMLLGHETICAVRLNDLPLPTKIYANWSDYDANP